jgi:hypothetical protein
MAKRNIDITDADIVLAKQVRHLLLAMLALPAGPLEHLVQLAHSSNGWMRRDPPEVFGALGITRQQLRMLWHFRSNLEAVMPQEARR